MTLNNSIGLPHGISLDLNYLVKDSLYNLDTLLIISSLAVVIDHKQVFVNREKDLFNVQLVNDLFDNLAGLKETLHYQTW